MISTEQTPVMGFNSFQGYGWSITEQEFRENVLFCDKELKPFGYRYMTLDFMWSTPGRDCRDNPDQDEAFCPWRCMDRYGRLTPSPDRFPSSAGSLSLKPLADFVHSRGMKFGLHIMCGVPKQAVAAKCPIKGTEYTCDQIVDWKAAQCSWNNEMYPVDFSHEAAQMYVNSLLELYDSWDVDLLKVDDLSFPYRKEAVEAYGKAVRDSRRSIVFSASPGATPLEFGEHIAQWANMWRISPDFWDTWDALAEQLSLLAAWLPYRKPGAYPDADILPVSCISLYGPWEAPRYSNFNCFEKRTAFSLWAIMNSPIILGGDLSAIDSPTLQILQNPYISVIDRFAEDAQISDLGNGLKRVFAGIKGSPELRIEAVVNISEAVQNCCEPDGVIINVWGNSTEFLAPHDCAMYIRKNG